MPLSWDAVEHQKEETNMRLIAAQDPARNAFWAPFRPQRAIATTIYKNTRFKTKNVGRKHDRGTFYNIFSRRFWWENQYYFNKNVKNTATIF